MTTYRLPKRLTFTAKATNPEAFDDLVRYVDSLPPAVPATPAELAEWAMASGISAHVRPLPSSGRTSWEAAGHLLADIVLQQALACVTMGYALRGISGE